MSWRADVPLRRGLRAVRDYLHFRPQRGFRPRTVLDGGLSSAAVAAELDAHGISVVQGLIADERLEAVRSAFAGLFEGADGRWLGPTNVPGTSSCHPEPSECPVLLDLVLHETVLAATESYFRKPIYLAAIQASRLEPVPPFEGDSYQWHHDAKGKYVKAMWLLTDVTMDGQRMSYVAGSHRRLRVTRSYTESRLSEREALGAGDAVVECVGPAGTLVLFDTNGIHRGNRNLGPRRDVVFGVYSAGRHLQGCSIDATAASRLSPVQRDVLQRSAVPSKGYERSDS